MRCEQSLGNLTALLHHELSQADTDELQRHLAVCETCRTEYREFSSIQDSLRTGGPVEPSAESRRDLQDQIDASIAGRRKGAATHERGSDTKPQWRLVTPPPQPALSYEPPKALPASPQNAPHHALPMRGTPDVTALSPSGRMRSISARLPAPAKGGRGAGGPVVWTAFAIVLLSIVAGVALYFKPPAQPADAFRTQRLTWGRRLDERNAAKVRGRLADTLVNTQIQLGAAAPTHGTLSVIPHSDPRNGEMCIVAYREADLASVRADSRVDQAAFEALLKQATSVNVDDGKCTLPRSWVEQFLNSDPRVSVLDLDNRVEIWSTTAFEKYLAGGNAFDPARSTQKSNGLPSTK